MDIQIALPWIIAFGALAVLTLALLWLTRRPAKTRSKPLPSEWNLSARPVFSTDERRVYRQLREALPHHIVLSKLPLVRFCQPTDPQQVRYWYELLGSIHVTFAVCSANGRVLAAIDLDTDRGNSRRVMQIKQSVLAACRVRYMRCPIDQIPSIAELQLLIPHSVAASRGPQPAPTSGELREPSSPAAAVPKRRERTTLWQDSGFFQDSFFAPDPRQEGLQSEFGQLPPAPVSTPAKKEERVALSDDDIPTEPGGGVVIEPGQRSATDTRH